MLTTCFGIDVTGIIAALGVGGIEHDRTKLERVYEIGRKEAEKQIAQLQAFLARKD